MSSQDGIYAPGGEISTVAAMSVPLLNDSPSVTDIAGLADWYDISFVRTRATPQLR